MKEVIFKLPDEVLSLIIHKVENTPQKASLLEKWIYDGEERKTGKWHYYRCSECKCLCTYFLRGSYMIDIEKRPNYCPHCGAKMEGEGDETD